MALLAEPYCSIGNPRELSSTKGDAQGRSSPDNHKPLSKPELRGMVVKSELWRGLSTRARSVFGLLWEYTNPAQRQPDGGYVLANAYPSRERLAELEGCSLSAIDRALNELRKAGLIVSVNRAKRAGKRNTYTLRVPAEMTKPIDRRPPKGTPRQPKSPPQECVVQRVENAPLNDAEMTRSGIPSRQSIPTYHHQRAVSENENPSGTKAGGGGGEVLTGEGEAKAKALEQLKARGVSAMKPITRKLQAGELTVEDIEAVLHRADRQENEVRAGLLVNWLNDPAERELSREQDRLHQENKRKRQERRAAEDREYAEKQRQLAEERRRDEERVGMYRQAVAAAKLKGDDATLMDIELVRSQLGMDARTVQHEEWSELILSAGSDPLVVFSAMVKLARARRQQAEDSQRETDEKRRRWAAEAAEARRREAEAAARHQAEEEKRAKERQAAELAKNVETIRAMTDDIIIQTMKRLWAQTVNMATLVPRELLELPEQDRTAQRVRELAAGSAEVAKHVVNAVQTEERRQAVVAKLRQPGGQRLAVGA